MTLLLVSSIALVAGGAAVAQAARAGRRPALSVRITRAGPAATADGRARPRSDFPDWLRRFSAAYERDLRRAGGTKTLRAFLREKVLLALAVPFVPFVPYWAATQRPPAAVVVLLFAAAGFFVPDLLLRTDVKRRREAIFLDLPEAISVLALALGAGQSLRRALELAGRDCAGPLGEELQRALSRARRQRGLDERQALVEVATEAGEPTFARFAELLAAKESPYLDFLRQQAAAARAEQNRYLERAADRAYLSMHAPLVPMLAVLVLLIAYGFLRFLAHTV